MNYTAPYKLWLQNKNYSTSTVKNYLHDLNKYLDFAGDEVFSFDTITKFLESLKNDSNINRYTSSLSKYLQFAQDQGLINTNPIRNSKTRLNSPSTDLDNLVTQYQNFLTKKHFSTATIKNYLNDIQQFISWANNTSDSK